MNSGIIQIEPSPSVSVLQDADLLVVHQVLRDRVHWKSVPSYIKSASLLENSISQIVSGGVQPSDEMLEASMSGSTETCSIIHSSEIAVGVPLVPDSNVSSTSPFSPKPCVSFSPVESDRKLLQSKSYRLLEELVESEEVYLVSLRLALHYYLEPLANLGPNWGVPFDILYSTLRSLISHHSKLMDSMLKILGTSTSHSHMSLSVSKLIGDYAINVFLYESYCANYENVIGLVKNSSICEEQQLKLDKHWTSGFGVFLEKTQPVGQRLDLSFSSLVQKPIARIAKYQLFLETLNKYVSEEIKAFVEVNIIRARDRLSKVNQNSRDMKKCSSATSIDELVSFEGLGTVFPICSSFFGPLLLCGATTLVWVESNLFGSSVCGILLFKSHLILVDLKKSKQAKKEPLFILSLAKCAIKPVEDFIGGLYTEYASAVILLFEHNSRHFEVLMAFNSFEEHQIWSNSLNISINIVNGPCKMSFEDDAECLMVYPRSLIPYDTSLTKLSQKEFQKCYFHQTKLVIIDVCWNDEPSYKFAPKNRVAPSCDNHYITVTRAARIESELLLAKLWSPEIPREALARNYTWKLGNMLKKSRSTNDTSGAAAIPISEPNFPSLICPDTHSSPHTERRMSTTSATLNRSTSRATKIKSLIYGLFR